MPIKWVVKDLAKRHGWTNANQLALGLGLSYPVAHRLMNDQMDRVDLTTLEKLCSGFDCDVGDLLAYEPEKASKKR